MEFIACLAGGIALMVCGVALFWLRPPNWQADGDLVDQQRVAIQRWSRVQTAVRWANNVLLVVIGALIACTAFVPHGRTWMLFWSGILLLLLVCILLAMIDAMSSLAGYRRALPEAARRSFSGRPDLAAIATEAAEGTPTSSGD